MNDLISRQAAIDALAKEMPSLTTPDGCGEFDHDIQITDEAFVDCMQIINELPSAQPEQRWIPCSERLPETEEFVLASLTGKYRNITFEHACEIADYADGEWLVYAYPHMSAEKCEELIEAWMPLPEPYKGGRTR